MCSSSSSSSTTSRLKDEFDTDLRLFVKAGADGSRYGACPFCQRVFMILMLKAEGGCLHFTVATVNLVKPSDEFRRLGLKRVPALAHGDRVYDSVDDIVQYVDESFPQVNLSDDANDGDGDSTAAENATKNLFSKFSFFVKEVSKDPAHLLAELARMDAYLSLDATRRRGRYLRGDRLTHLDCELLPKLQHVRVACAGLKRLEIPAGLEGLWRYLYGAYCEPTFVKTCPCDQEIVLHWANKAETPNISLERRAALTKDAPRYSLDVPARAVPAQATVP